MPISPIIPAPVRTFIDLFDAQLEQVVFPDVDRASLYGHADEVGAALSALEDARAQVDAARQSLESAQAVLLRHARKGLAYARIYAEDMEDLDAELCVIALDPAPKARKRRRRKVPVDLDVAASLPLEQEALRVAS